MMGVDFIFLAGIHNSTQSICKEHLHPAQRPDPLVGSWELCRVDNILPSWALYQGLDFYPTGTGNRFGDPDLGLVPSPFNWHSPRTGWIYMSGAGEFEYIVMGDYVKLTYRAEGLVLRRGSTTTTG